MYNTIREEIKESFRKGSMLTRLIYINLAVFIAVNLIIVFGYLFNSDTSFILNWLAVPADLQTLITRPWTLITYMFLQKGFLHVLFNVLALYWFGRIFMHYLDQQRLLYVYILGGLAGAGVFILAFNVFPAFEAVKSQAIALGASASLLAIITAIAFLIPDHQVYVPLIAKIKLKYIAIVIILLDLLSITRGNPGGHLAHLGGALMGLYFTWRYQKGEDITKWMAKSHYKLREWFASGPKTSSRKAGTRSSKAPETDMEYNARKAAEQKEINKILEKISRSGYSSLTKKEKERLFNSSKRK